MQGRSRGSWTAAGTVHNPTKATSDYTVSMTFLDTAGLTVGGAEGSAPAPLKPGTRATWRVSASGVPTTAATCTIEGAYRS
jgi:acyl dehydratase